MEFAYGVKQKREARKWISQCRPDGEILLFGDYDRAAWRKKSRFVLQNGIFRGESTRYFDEWLLSCAEIG